MKHGIGDAFLILLVGISARHSGPTECTVNVTMQQPQWPQCRNAGRTAVFDLFLMPRCLVKPGDGVPSIGEPVVGMQLYVLVPRNKGNAEKSPSILKIVGKWNEK